MLTCHACMKRCLGTLIGDSAVFPSAFRSALDIRTDRRRQNYATSSDVVRRRQRELQPQSSRQVQVYKSKTALAPRSDNRKQWLDSRGGRPSKPSKPTADKIIDQHLVYLKDPLKLADSIRKTLRDGDFETAQKIVRAASKDVQCIVSWNHLVDWQVTQGKLNAAIKTYNEMKKRAQHPDAHTYTILFNGAAEKGEKDAKSADFSLSKVMAIYYSMLSEKSLVRPNVIHLNAVIKMCARARNMDALFAIVDQMPRKGLGAANNLTYTTILNALRINTSSDDPRDPKSDLTAMQKRQNAQKAILDARRIWSHLTKRWRNGDIWIDEELVCAMGRILLLGIAQDKDDIMSLYEQAFNIPRLVPRMGTPDRQLIEPSAQGKYPSAPTSAIETPVSEEQPRAVERFRDTPETHFAIIQPGSGYALPGPNALSLLMKALFELHLIEPARKYWNILTTEMKVKPDQENYISFLRILRIARASTESVQLLQKMPLQDLKAKTFRISMSTCERDKRNRHAFSNATRIVDLMHTALREPDVSVLVRYLDIAMISPAYSDQKSQDKNDVSKAAQGKQILHALNRIHPSFLNLRAALLFDDTSTRKDAAFRKAVTNRRIFTHDVLSLTQSMISAYDSLMNKAMVPRDDYLELTKARSKLAAFVTKHKHKKDKIWLAFGAPDSDPEISDRPMKRPRESLQRHLTKETPKKREGSRNKPREEIEEVAESEKRALMDMIA